MGRALLHAGREVVCVARTELGREALAAAEVYSLRGDLNDPDTLADAIRAADSVVETAGADNHHAVRTLLGIPHGTGKR